MTPRLALLALLLACGCAPQGPEAPDGCYSIGAVPAFRIAGGLGTVTVPGEVRTFRVERRGAGTVTFAPGILFDKVDGELRAFANADDAPLTYRVVPGTPDPKIVIHYRAYGDGEAIADGRCG